jgi:hypothetical protein
VDVLLELLGWLGSAVLVVSLLQTRVLRFRVLNTVAALVLVVYNAVLGVWPMVGLNVVITGINLWVIARLLRERHDDRAYEVVPIGTGEAYLHSVLALHHDDIARYNPQLPDAPGDVVARADLAFLVLARGQTVGVVLARRTGEPGEAEVVLDYVLPHYRDFTPGEFVYRAGGPFPTAGVTRVVAPQGMREAERYLASVGFRTAGTHKVLTL